MAQSSLVQSACPSCGSSKESDKEFCSSCASFMVDIVSQDDEFCCAKSTTSLPFLDPASLRQQPFAQERDCSEEQEEWAARRELTFTSSFENEHESVESCAASSKRRKLDVKESSERGKDENSGADPAEGHQTPARRSAVLPAVVTPPSFQMSQHQAGGDSVVLNLKINSADTITKQWLFEAQCKCSFLDIQPQGSCYPPAKAQIIGLSVVAQGQGIADLTFQPHNTNVSKATSNASTKVKGTCGECGKEKEDDWRVKCKKCFAKQKFKEGQSNKQRGTCEDCGKKAEEDWMYKCKACWEKQKLMKEENETKKQRGTCEDCGEKAEEDWMSKCKACWGKQKSTKEENLTKAEEGRICIDCRKFKTNYDWMNRCQACFRKYRQSQPNNQGGTCRYCSLDLGDPLKTCCVPCFQKHKVNKPAGSVKCPGCGKEPEDPKWMIWCHLCYRNKKN